MVLVKLTGVLLIVLGIMVFLKPDSLKQMLAFFIPGKRIYIASLMQFIFGVIFIAASSDCRNRAIILIFGILALVKCISGLMLGRKRISAFIKFWQQKPVSILRMLSLVYFIIGALIIYSV